MTIVDQLALQTAANTTTPNVLQGRRFERAPFTGLLAWYATGSAAGLEAELNVGGRSVSPRLTVSAANRLPLVPDDMIVSEVEVYQGELIQITQVNTTGGALTGNHRIELTEAEYA